MAARHRDQQGSAIEAVTAARRTWEADVRAPALRRFNLDEPPDRFFGPDDVPDYEFLRDVNFPGMFPFTAGVYATQSYEAGHRGSAQIPRARGLARAGRYSGYGTAEDTAAYYARMIAEGQRSGPNVAFDLPTQCGYDSDAPEAEGEVGRTGVAICSLEDLRALYAPFRGDLEIDRIGSNWTINAPACVIVAMYLAIALERGIDPRRLRATPQNDILKEYVARGTYIFPPRPAMRLVRNLFAFIIERLPAMNVVSCGGYHIREAGATREIDLGLSVAHMISYVEAGLEQGLDIDVLAPRFTVNSFGGSLELLKEVAFQRAARRMWARVMRDRFHAKEPRSWILRQPSGAHMGYHNATVERPLNNLARAVVGAIAGALSGYAPTVEPPYDEPLSLGWSREAMQLSEDAARILQHEAKLTEVRDPLAGSYYIERLTDDIESAAWRVVSAVDEQGGAVSAIESGFEQELVAEAAIERGRDLLDGRRMVVGVNAFTGEEEIDVRVERRALHMYDPQQLATAEERQRRKLNELRRLRDARSATAALQGLEAAARVEDINVMQAILSCVEALCTIGEICDVLRGVFGEYRYGPAA